ncbi:SubName: Full=Related to UBP1-ubiquitin-specific protease {ECO:0000313/EMBL:CCA71698.1} [Serendipita indica DSM 11827]|nr:SubName: Full=Related to UBP1-ubiquitin-specific protease {ECO:0000313/EMBL:CCA71698.1} [Serendipita indica DSM 11827]
MHPEQPPVIFSPTQALLILALIFVVPVLLLNPVFDVSRTLAMLFEALGLGFLLGKSTDDESYSYDHRKDKRKKIIRSRAEQAASTSEASHHSGKYYPGLVNISGTYCFLNSTLQAMASLSYLQPYLDSTHAKADLADVPTPVLDALVAQMHSLNSPSSRHTSLRPTELIHALSTPTPGFKRGTLFASREHQDAQELFQLITETLKEEARAVDTETTKDRGLGGLGTPHQVYLQRSAREPGKGVFEGLTANRRSCVMCGYTEAVMHFTFDNLQLTIPRVSQCRIEDCLEDFTRMEILTDCICRKCSMTATLRKLEADAIRIATPVDGVETSSRKKRTKDVKKLAAKVKEALETGRIEEDIKGVTLEKVISKSSTKQAMIARAPPVLALHLNRSAFYGHYAAKNNCSVSYPEILDLTPFTTSGALSTSPQSPISKPTPGIPPRSSTPTPSTYSNPRTLYRLASVVCHYGAHSYGHYVAYRRKPRDPSLRSSRWNPPQLQCPYGCTCDKCEEFGPVREPNPFADVTITPSRKGKERSWETKQDVWLRISDESVKEVDLETVLSERTGSFMLFYEKVLPFQSDGDRTSPMSSQETVTPHQEERKVKPEDLMDHDRLQPFTARIVRSVSVGRSREGSVILGSASDVGAEPTETTPANSHPNGHADPQLPNGSASTAHDTTNGTKKPHYPSSHVSGPPLLSPSPQCVPQSLSPTRTVDLVA